MIVGCDHQIDRFPNLFDRPRTRSDVLEVALSDVGSYTWTPIVKVVKTHGPYPSVPSDALEPGRAQPIGERENCQSDLELCRGRSDLEEHGDRLPKDIKRYVQDANLSFLGSWQSTVG